MLKIHDITLNFEKKSQRILQNMGPKVRIVQIHIKDIICSIDHEVNILVNLDIYEIFPFPSTFFFDVLKTKLQSHRLTSVSKSQKSISTNEKGKMR